MLEKVLNLQIRIDQKTYLEAKKRIDDLASSVKVAFPKIPARGSAVGAAREKKSWAQETAERQLKDIAKRRTRASREAENQKARADRERLKKINNTSWYMKEAGFDKKEIEYWRRKELGQLSDTQYTDLMQKHRDEIALGRGRLNQRIGENKPSAEEKQEEQRKEQRQRQYDQRGGIYSNPATQRILGRLFRGNIGTLTRTLGPLGAAVGAFKIAEKGLTSINNVVTPLRAGEFMRAAPFGSTIANAGATGAGTPFSQFTGMEMGSVLDKAYQLRMHSMFNGMPSQAATIGLNTLQSPEEMLVQINKILGNAQKSGPEMQRQVSYFLSQLGFSPTELLKLGDKASWSESTLSAVQGSKELTYSIVGGNAGFSHRSPLRAATVSEEARAQAAKQQNALGLGVYKPDITTSSPAVNPTIIINQNINGTTDPEKTGEIATQRINETIRETIKQVSQ